MKDSKDKNKRAIFIYKIISSVVFVAVIALSLFYGIRYAEPTGTAEAQPTSTLSDSDNTPAETIKATDAGSSTDKPSSSKNTAKPSRPSDTSDSNGNSTVSPDSSLEPDPTPEPSSSPIIIPKPSYAPAETSAPSSTANPEPSPPLEEQLSVTVFPCSGSPIFVRCGDYSVLINTGAKSSDSTIITNYLKSIGVSKIDTLVITHPSSDNIAGVADIMEELFIEHVILPDIPREYITPAKDLLKAENAIQSAERITYLSSEHSGYTESFAGYSMKIFVPQEIADPYQYTSYSLAVYLDAGSRSLLLSCDFPVQVQGEIAVPADFLVLPNYGVNGSLSKELLENVRPKYAIFKSHQSYVLSTDKTEGMLAAYDVKSIKIGNRMVQITISDQGNIVME